MDITNKTMQTLAHNLAGKADSIHMDMVGNKMTICLADFAAKAAELSADKRAVLNAKMVPVLFRIDENEDGSLHVTASVKSVQDSGGGFTHPTDISQCDTQAKLENKLKLVSEIATRAID